MKQASTFEIKPIHSLCAKNVAALHINVIQTAESIQHSMKPLTHEYDF